MRKSRRALRRPEDWEKHLKVLKRLAAPKVPPKPPTLRQYLGLPPPAKAQRGKKKPRRVFNPAYTLDLARVPSRRRLQPLERDPFSVARGALYYNISERMTNLACAKVRPNNQNTLELGKVKPGALQAKATARTLELAKSAARPPGLETDLKENAFSVAPRALKAFCRPRIKILAQPKRRKKRH